MKRFPVYLQHDSMQCGIACLQMICKYYGKEYTLAGLSELCFATNEGVSLLGISQAAEEVGAAYHLRASHHRAAGQSRTALHCTLEPEPFHCALSGEEKKEGTPVLRGRPR